MKGSGSRNHRRGATAIATIAFASMLGLVGIGGPAAAGEDDAATSYVGKVRGAHTLIALVVDDNAARARICATATSSPSGSPAK